MVFTIALETGVSLITIGIPLVAGLSVVHGLDATASSSDGSGRYFKADVGKTILYALIVGLPAAIISGPLYGKWIGARIHKEVPLDIAEQFVEKDNKKSFLALEIHCLQFYFQYFLCLVHQ